MSNNVIQLFNRNVPKAAQTATSQVQFEMAQEAVSQNTGAVGLTFQQIAEKNKINQDRLRKERDLANKSVLKSHRLK
jgi:hypothetical protein